MLHENASFRTSFFTLLIWNFIYSCGKISDQSPNELRKMALRLKEAGEATGSLATVIERLSQDGSNLVPLMQQSFRVTELWRTREFLGPEARLFIDVFENNLVTEFRGERHEIMLSNALGTLHRLSIIFEEITQAGGLQEAPPIEDQFHRGLIGSGSDDIILSVDGNERIAILRRSAGDRLRLTVNSAQSVMPLSTVQPLSHFFNPEFAQALGFETVSDVHFALRNLYLERCVVGLLSFAETQEALSPPVQREAQRILAIFLGQQALYPPPKR